MKRITAVILLIAMAVTFCACSGDSTSEGLNYNLDFSTAERVTEHSLATSDGSEKLTLSPESAQAVKDSLYGVRPEFYFEHLYETDESLKRVSVEVDVEEHSADARDGNGALDASRLFSVVKANNGKLFASGDNFGYAEISDSDLQKLCALIVDTVKEVERRYPDIDYDRVYCNLGNLKIVYNQIMTAFAAVDPDMMMQISAAMFKGADAMADRNGARNTVIHEIMHIIQAGCICENIEHCTLRCGISYSYDDFPMNTGDLGFLFEGSAERMMSNITGDKLFTYETYIGYVCSLNMCTAADPEVPASYAETLCFYDDIDKLFDLFCCKTEEDKKEVLNMMIAINIIQRHPENLLQAYGAEVGKDVSADEVTAELFCSLKPAIATVWTKRFYTALATALESGDVTENDLCFLIALYEVNLSRHMKVDKADYDVYNAEFKTWYRSVRSDFFEKIKNCCGVDIEEYYESYSFYEGDKRVNASLFWAGRDKIAFYMERCDYLTDFMGYKM